MMSRIGVEAVSGREDGSRVLDGADARETLRDVRRCRDAAGDVAARYNRPAFRAARRHIRPVRTATVAGRRALRGPVPTLLASSLSFVAHEDDDLLFQNPDISDWIVSGLPHCTVFVTAGEFDGLGNRTREEYAADRQNGERAAYALMAGVADHWDRSSMDVDGRPIEIDTLTDAPGLVQLVFLCLPDGGDANHLDALGKLFRGESASQPTIVPTGGPVANSLTYTRAELISTLTSLMEIFQPTIIRAQDPCPDPRAADDHQDHIATAQFVAEAVADYHGPDSCRHAALVNYRCYSIAGSQPNLTGQRSAEKASIFATYAASDPQAHDLGWTSSRYYRWPSGSVWAARDGLGTPRAFAVLDGQVMAWHQDPISCLWEGPKELGGGPVAPHLAVGHNADGRLEVFAFRIDTGDITTAFQTGPDLAFSDWVNLGNPDGTGSAATGTPTVASNRDGRMQVFARNPSGGMSTIAQNGPNLDFSDWQDVDGGTDLINEPAAAVVTADGRIELFASSGDGVEHWFQPVANGPLEHDPAFPSRAAAGAPQAAKGRDYLLRVFYRNPQDGHVLASLQAAVNGGWDPVVSDLGGPAGQGQITVLTRPAPDGRLVLATRADPSTEYFDLQEDDGTFAGLWTELPCSLRGVPAGVLQANNVLAMLGIGTDGFLYVNQQTMDGPPFGFQGWIRAGA
ncbi:PIG-L family deacetylase [Arthrobacter sp. PsM3]|uniref:PIG-L family deacetylase n=1 Tax=Arthrobacter sp. PsM3 TaxID=3030531 RepID=UPI00263A61A1|nr:PIG-L family deacetylase [Arthrobacter sp. PsM3]MDN4645984.1 PIG-L family deacetylase [Arthrobacter sp. PsM3]